MNKLKSRVCKNNFVEVFYPAFNEWNVVASFLDKDEAKHWVRLFNEFAKSAVKRGKK